ncbi:MAG TPA: SGNH/GDSL hydrolase family protein [Flavitalea sp.]|nr:SGNH/GDSL hydrolase family protein [Flavitalea sp.]
MKKIFKYITGLMIFIGLHGIASESCAQKPAFYDEIQSFKKQDSAAMPAKNSILFVGSSSIRMWTNIKDDFRMHSVINRGLGGSALPDVIRYADEIIFHYQPAQVVIYCGENDLAASDTVTAQIVFERFQTLFNMIRKKLPETAVAFVSIKPSPSRAHLLPKVIAANNLIKDFLKGQTKAVYIDVFSAMIDQQGNPKPELFVDDKLHMNQKGYAIWVEIIEPYLIKT